MYPHFISLVQHFAHLGAWQKRALALWCCGVLLAEKCQLSAVADALVCAHYPSVSALTKRLSRFLSNPRISDELLTQSWVHWVARRYESAHWVILVDETKLGNHLAVMLVSVAYRQRAIPLLWRCYPVGQYPLEGQVAMIGELLARLKLLLPADLQLTVQADRGIGTSPALIRRLEQLEWRYQLRVQRQVRLRLRNGRVHAMRDLVKPGEDWCGRAQVFKKAGWLSLYVCLHWRWGERDPWCLVSNSPWRQADDYALRAWQEQSFRDLKSFGFHWQASQVWQPAHAQRLLLVLALAYTWVLAQAQAWTEPARGSPSRRHPRESLFRRGLRWLRPHAHLFHLPLCFPDLNLLPFTPLLC